jgi:uncharacterized membrane protein YkoI
MEDPPQPEVVMQRSILATSLVLGALLAPACRSTPGWSNEDALAAQSVEIQLDADAHPLEVEYHVLPDAVPAGVMAAMDALHPGGRAIAAEMEYVGTTLYWEVSKEVDGREVEAMFHPDGTLHSQELEVDAATVPEAVRAAARARMPGQVTKWEEIRDGDQELVEYHVKVTADDMKYKVVVSTAGSVLGVVREVPAEIEVPLP